MGAVLATLPKARFKADGDAIRKAMAMVRRGKSDEYISDYLGMALPQVQEIRGRMPSGLRGRPPAVVPTTRWAAAAYERQRAPLAGSRSAEEAAAEEGSAQFRRELLRYGAKHGLPNLSRLQCLSEMRLLGMIREEELALADRIEAELARPSKLKDIDW